MYRTIRQRSLFALVSFVATINVAAAGESDLRLLAAMKAQNAQAVRALLAEGVDVNTTAADGATALLWAAHWDDLGTVERLLKAGAKVDLANDHGVTPLALACENANAALVDRLLEGGADPKRARQNGVTPLMTASRTGNLAIVKSLLARGADANVAIPAGGQTALMWATAEGHHDVVRALVAAGADVHAQSKIGFTPLLFAARNGDIDAAGILIGSGAGVNELGSDGTHPLALGIVSGHDPFAMFLLDQGANANATMFGVGALHAAAGNVDMWLRDWFRARQVDYARNTIEIGPARRAALVKALLARGADPNARITTPMTTGVQGWLTVKRGAFEPFSVGTGNLTAATPLWVAAFDMHGGSGRGFFAMDAAAKTERPAIVKELLKAGADVSLATKDGTTPLMVAAGLGRGTYLPGQKRGARTPNAEETVKLLLDAGAAVNVTNEAGFTALHGAAFKGLNEVIETLVTRGADINARDYRGRTPFRLAEGSKQTFQFQTWPETADLLAKLGADTTLGKPGHIEEREMERNARKGNAGGQEQH
jgi:ankyrin repeat protein